MPLGACQGNQSFGIILSKVLTNFVDITAGGAAHDAKC
jgi:hypothetical protein